jgi:Kef-type K+ transport system membrane component KefB
VSGGRVRTPAARIAGAGVALLLVGLMFGATRAVPGDPGPAGSLAAFGFLLLAGSALAAVLEPIGFPHLTAYLVAGVLAGPHVLHLVDHRAVADLQVVNTVALALIALAGGAELRLANLRGGLRGLAWATFVQNATGLLGMAAVFFLARPLVPFARELPVAAAAGVALLWGVIAITRSPSATLGILAQTRARGPVTSYALNFVMTSDVVVVIVMALVLMAARPLLEPGASFALGALGDVGHELLGSIAIGTTLGLVLAAYLRLVGRQVLLVLLALGLVFSELFAFLRFEWLLIFIVAGFVVQNLSRQGPRFLHEVERAGEVIYVVFFATAGAHLDLPLVVALWPAALVLAGSRAVIALGAQRVSSRLARDPPVVARWGFAGLVSQAGLALGIAAKVAGEFPEFGQAFGALAVAVVAVNEVAGPVLFKLALDRAGESAATDTAAAAGVEGSGGVDPT